MDPAVIFIIILIVGVIISVIWFAIIIRDKRIEQEASLPGSGTSGGSSPPSSQSQTGWGKETPVSGDRGMCSLYTFPATAPGQPGIPILNTNFVDNLTPGEIGNVTCIDADQLALQKVNQPCQGNSAIGNVCYGTNATVYQPGQNRQFYVQCNSTKCNDTLAVTALNFDPEDFINPPAVKSACLQFNIVQPSEKITGEMCNLTDENQILRVERQNPNGTASDTGVYGRFVDRNTGLCVVPSVIPPTTGTSLQLGQCSPSDGYVWWFFSPTNIVTTVTTSVAPQQLVYYPNNGKAPPKGEALNTFIETKNPLSMSVNVNTDGNSTDFGNTNYGQLVTLQPISKTTRNNTSNGTVGSAPNAQTIDYWLYETISQTPVTCLECGTNFTF